MQSRLSMITVWSLCSPECDSGNTKVAVFQSSSDQLLVCSRTVHSDGPPCRLTTLQVQKRELSFRPVRLCKHDQQFCWRQRAVQEAGAIDRQNVRLNSPIVPPEFCSITTSVEMLDVQLGLPSQNSMISIWIDGTWTERPSNVVFTGSGNYQQLAQGSRGC